jgi:hypothetical protein
MSSPITASKDFRNVVLRVRNVASFKFALAKSILSLTEPVCTRGHDSLFSRRQRESARPPSRQRDERSPTGPTVVPSRRAGV